MGIFYIVFKNEFSNPKFTPKNCQLEKTNGWYHWSYVLHIFCNEFTNFKMTILRCQMKWRYSIERYWIFVQGTLTYEFVNFKMTIFCSHVKWSNSVGRRSKTLPYFPNLPSGGRFCNILFYGGIQKLRWQDEVGRLFFKCQLYLISLFSQHVNRR